LRIRSKGSFVSPGGRRVIMRWLLATATPGRFPH